MKLLAVNFTPVSGQFDGNLIAEKYYRCKYVLSSWCRRTTK